jgi:hypothetical protein
MIGLRSSMGKGLERVRWSGVVALVAVIAAGLTSCGGPDAGQLTVDCPPSDPGTFRLVSTVLEARCGTLDCHGSSFRPLRIYGRSGLRRPETPESLAGAVDPGTSADYTQYFTGGAIATTNAELIDNARAACGLEPEKIAEFRAAVAEGNANVLDLAGELTLIRKARLREKHKGGLIWDQGTPGDQCLVSWLTGTINNGKCEEEMLHP